MILLSNVCKFVEICRRGSEETKQRSVVSSDNQYYFWMYIGIDFGGRGTGACAH